jgi:hypothetical protein
MEHSFIGHRAASDEEKEAEAHKRRLLQAFEIVDYALCIGLFADSPITCAPASLWPLDSWRLP